MNFGGVWEKKLNAQNLLLKCADFESSTFNIIFKL
jgi:hypothetical protein